MVTGLDGKEYRLKLPKIRGVVKDSRPRSKLHISVRRVLRELYPYDTIHEEITLAGSKTPTRKSVLYADFFLPSRDLMIEAHGKQHFEFVPHYHKNKTGFYKSKARDRDKSEWCEVNNIDLLIFRHDETEEDWRSKIERR